MAEHASSLIQQLTTMFPKAQVCADSASGELTLDIAPEDWQVHAVALRDTLSFEQLTDLCVVDYLGYGQAEWNTQTVSSKGFSRGVEGQAMGRFSSGESPKPPLAAVISGAAPFADRFGVIAHVRSYRMNVWIRMRCFLPDVHLPTVASLTCVWPSADWYEREAFDLFGLVFQGHPDLRRLLTDYGFVGHPFRKDFPLNGNVEVRYNAVLQRVIYEPVQSVQPRVGVARVVRPQTERLLQSDDLLSKGGV